MKISAIVITKNEAGTIERCLQALAFADERIVVDAGSNDATVELARKAGATVFTNPWPGYGPQKNVGLSHAQGEWVLFIDADEEVSPALAREIQTAIQDSSHDFYWLKIVTVFLGRPLTHLFGHNPRLFKKSAGRWTGAHVHEQVEHTDEEITIKLNDAHSAKLGTPLLHHSHPTIASYLQSMHQYTTLDAKEMAITHKHRSGRPIGGSPFLPLTLAVRQFLKLLFYRHGFLDGYAGLVWCTMSAYYEWEMAGKYLQLKK
ncbi:MAG: glycosyltransferase family 2 protein [Candidatus Andersenbacteria bacterium]|nr:glycosyltransferase family 2 protein [Candidatus Andersenbacteria bacterium]